MRPRPIAIDLFAGCGGLSLGLEAAGFDIAAAVEIDPIHCLVHHYNFPYSVTICQDITQLKAQDILTQIDAQGFTDDIDLIAGGPPCQGFSVMGKRQFNDPRNQLIFEYLRIIKEIRPKYFLFENVPGILKVKHKSFLREFVESFESHGYQVVQPIQVLDASHFGAPQRRKRLILIGYRQELFPPQYPTAIYGNVEDRKINFALQSLTTVKDVLGDLEKIPVFVGRDLGLDSHFLDYQGFRKNYDLNPLCSFQKCHHRFHKNKVWGHLGSRHRDESIQRFRETLPGKMEQISHFLKLAPLGISNTLRAGTASDKGAYTAPRPIHYQHPRCITIREAARLHTFPDWFQFHRTIWHGFREIGNSVIPFLAKSLGEEIIKCLEIDINQIKPQKLEEIDNTILSFNMSKAAKFWDVPTDRIPKRKRMK